MYYKISTNVEKTSYLQLRGRLLVTGKSFASWLQEKINEENGLPIDRPKVVEYIAHNYIKQGDLVRAPHSPTPPLQSTVTPVSDEGRCEVPNIPCRLLGKRYLVALPSEEGFVKKKLYLCAFHLAKAKREADSVEEA